MDSELKNQLDEIKDDLKLIKAMILRNTLPENIRAGGKSDIEAIDKYVEELKYIITKFPV